MTNLRHFQTVQRILKVGLWVGGNSQNPKVVYNIDWERHTNQYKWPIKGRDMSTQNKEICETSLQSLPQPLNQQKWQITDIHLFWNFDLLVPLRYGCNVYKHSKQLLTFSAHIHHHSCPSHQLPPRLRSQTSSLCSRTPPGQWGKPEYNEENSHEGHFQNDHLINRIHTQQREKGY